MPEKWSNRFGYEVSPNRRYRAVNQITGKERLAELSEAAHEHGCPLLVALNEHEYNEATWSLAMELAGEAMECGADGFILASPSVFSEIKAAFPDALLHVSGEGGVVNSASVELFARMGATRIIFGREIGLKTLAPLSRKARALGLEVEVFIMGEPCVFDGARCFAAHGYGQDRDFCNSHTRKVLRTRGRREAADVPPPLSIPPGTPPQVVALGKCGLCFIPELREMGVTHLKVPGRSTDSAVRAVKLVSRFAETDRDPIEAVTAFGRPEICRTGSFCYFSREPSGP